MGVKRSCAQHSYRSDFGLRVAISKNEINDIFPFFFSLGVGQVGIVHSIFLHFTHTPTGYSVPMETRKSESVQSQKWNVIGWHSRVTTHIGKEQVKGAAADIISWV